MATVLITWHFRHTKTCIQATASISTIPVSARIYDTETEGITKDFDIKTKLEEAGLGLLSPAILPMAHSSDNRFFYFQLSFLHGLVEFDMETEKVTRLAELLNLIPPTPKISCVNDFAHYGLAISVDNKKL